MSRVARNNASNYASIAVCAAIAGLITLSTFVGLLVHGDIAGAAGCLTGAVTSFIILKMSITRLRYAELIVATYLQKDELAKLKQLLE